MTHSGSFLLLLLCLAALPGVSARAAEKTPADLVVVKQGALPIIVTAPHGGREEIPGIEPRRDRTNDIAYRAWGGFQRGADANTDTLALDIAAEIARLTGKEPYVVVAKFMRRYIDANRPVELALDSSAARPYYDYYHQAIHRFVDEIRTNYPAGLLVDVHGQSKDPEVIMRGTVNGRAVERLLRRAGVDAVTGRNGIFGQLEANGFKVFPGNDVPPRDRSEDGGFNGGYTVSIYGSNNRTGIHSVQLEIGSRYRDKAVLDKTARDVARSIAAFHAAYLKQESR